MELILASSSPRRKELLELIGLKPEIIIPTVREKIKSDETWDEFLKRITFAKGQSIYEDKFFNSIIVSADTIVIFEKTLIGKPENREDAFAILQRLSDKMHEVRTGLSIFYKGKTWFELSRTKVYFDSISDSEIEYYLDNEHYIDKAGAYAIQGRASVFVKRIEGCFFNVMGFPLHLFIKMLRSVKPDFYGN